MFKKITILAFILFSCLHTIQAMDYPRRTYSSRGRGHFRSKNRSNSGRLRGKGRTAEGRSRGKNHSDCGCLRGKSSSDGGRSPRKNTNRSTPRIKEIVVFSQCSRTGVKKLLTEPFASWLKTQSFDQMMLTIPQAFDTAMADQKKAHIIEQRAEFMHTIATELQIRYRAAEIGPHREVAQQIYTFNEQLNIPATIALEELN